MIKVCKQCGKSFKSGKHRKYCSIECSMAELNTKSPLCWDCANACGNCSWSQNFTPVTGWEAQKVALKIRPNTIISSYNVIKCPKFKRG